MYFWGLLSSFYMYVVDQLQYVQYAINKMGITIVLHDVLLQLLVRQISAILPTRPTATSITCAETKSRPSFLASMAKRSTRLLGDASGQVMAGKNSRAQSQPGGHC